MPSNNKVIALRAQLLSRLQAARPYGQRFAQGLRGALQTKRARRIAIGLSVCLVLYALLGFIALPLLVQPRLEHMLGESLHRELKAESLYFNPFAFSVRARGVRIADARADAPPSDQVLLSADELYANVSLSSLLRGVPVFDSVRLLRPHLQLRRNEDRSYNVQDLIDEWRSKPEDDPTRFSLDDLEVVDGRIDFDDRTTGEKHEITALNLAVPFLSNQLSDVDIKVQPSLSALVDGAPLAIQGETTPFHDTHQTVLRLKLDQLQVSKYLSYLPLRLHFDLASGTLDADLQLTLSTGDGKLKSLSLSGIALAQGIELQQLSGDTIASIPSLRIALESYDFIGNELRISHLDITQPKVHLMRYKDGRFNAVALSAAPLPSALSKTPTGTKTAPSPPPKPFRFHVAQASLQGGTLGFKDIYDGRSYQLDLRNVVLGAKKLGSGERGQWQLSFGSVSKERAEGSGSLAFGPFAMDGQLKLGAVQLKQWSPYYASLMTLDVREGLLNAQTHFEAASGEPFKLRFSDGVYSLRNAQLGVTGERAVLWRFPEIDIRGVEIDVTQRRTNAAEVSGTKGGGLIRRLSDGKLLMPNLLLRKDAPANEGPPWQRSLQKLSLRGFALDYEDQTRAKPVKVSATYIDVDGTNLSTAMEAPAQISLKAMLNKTGTLSLAGPLSSTGGTLALEARGIDLTQFEPYWSDAVNLNLRRGLIGARGQLIAAKSPEGQWRFGYKGHARFGDVQAHQRDTDEELLTWRSLFFRNLNIESSPLKTSVERIIFSDFYSRLVLRADGTLNLKSLRAPQGATSEKPKAAASPTESAARPVMDVGGIELRNGRVSFADYFIKPNYSAELKEVAGTVSALKPEKAGEVEIRAAMNGNAPVLITGLINPLAKEVFLDLNASAQGIDLPSLSPYSIKYAGYGIERGKLSFKAHYLLENRLLSADNQIRLDQLSFGPRSSGAGGPDLPVHLAVALLKDRNGVIDINLPISGSLDDPQFSLGGLIGRMFLNLLFKAVTSPFALIGSMFGGGDSAELSYIEFEPGSAIPKDAAKEKFNKVAQALKERPELKLDVIGRSDPVVDRDALRRDALLRDLRAQKALATGAAKSEGLEIGADEYNKYLTLAYQASSISKPRNIIGMAKDIPPAEMEKLLLEGGAPGDDRLRALANERAQAAINALIDQDGPRERIYLVSPRLDIEDIKEGATTRVDFALR